MCCVKTVDLMKNVKNIIVPKVEVRGTFDNICTLKG